jgi:hypothetical protein
MNPEVEKFAAGLPYPKSLPEVAEALSMLDHFCGVKLTAAEEKFVIGVAQFMRRRPPSPAQMNVLRDIGARYGYRPPSQGWLRNQRQGRTARRRVAR